MHHSLGVLATWKIILLKNWIIILHRFLRSKQHKKSSHFLHLKKCQEASACCIQEVRRKSHSYKKFTICMSNKAMGKISFIQTTLTRDVNGHCKLWSPKLCCGVFFIGDIRWKCTWFKAYMTSYKIHTITATIKLASKMHLWVWLTNQGRRKTKEGNTDLKLPPLFSGE